MIGKLITFPKERIISHLEDETFFSRMAQIKESINKINKLMADLKSLSDKSEAEIKVIFKSADKEL